MKPVPVLLSDWVTFRKWFYLGDGEIEDVFDVERQG